MQLHFTTKYFSDLTPIELYAAIRLRNEVFVVEQNCVFQDADDKDIHCHHLFLWDHETLVAYARLVPKNIAYDNYISIGRVVGNLAYRRKGTGKLLMAKAIETCNTIFGKQTIKIGAQLYLKKFYESFGFRQVDAVYLEDGIEHIYMLLHQD